MNIDGGNYSTGPYDTILPPPASDPSWGIRPDKTINETVIRENWDDLLRLVAAIKLKENTASDIFRRLNSYSRQHALYQTLKAFGQIIKSLFILRYVDDLALRQAIEKQLNKVELSNRFTRAVAVGNPREYSQTEKEEKLRDTLGIIPLKKAA